MKARRCSPPAVLRDGPRKDIVTPNEHGTSLGAHIASEYQFFSEDLALSLVEPFRPNEEVAQEIGPLAEPPLSPPLTMREQESGPGKGQERTLYLRADAPVAPQGQAQTAVYEEAAHEWPADGKDRARGGPHRRKRRLRRAALQDQNVLPGARFGGSGVDVIDANADLSTVVISLQAGIAGSQEGLYEWREGALTPVTVPPCEEGSLVLGRTRCRARAWATTARIFVTRSPPTAHACSGRAPGNSTKATCTCAPR